MQLEDSVVAALFTVKGTIQERSHNDVHFFEGGRGKYELVVGIVKHIGLTNHHHHHHHHQVNIVSCPISIQRNFRCP